MGGILFHVQLENRHASARDTSTARKRFFVQMAAEADRFTCQHKLFNVPVNSQITDAPGFEQEVTEAVPDCVSCFATRVTPAISRPQVLIGDTVCMARLVLLNTASTAIQMVQYCMDLVYSTVDGSRPHNRPDLTIRDEMQ